MVIVELNETFQLFKPFTSTSGRYKHSLTLQMPGLSCSVHIMAEQSTSSRINVLTPFRPELGYVIDERDSQLESRENKVQTEYNTPPPQKIFHAEAPLALSVTLHDVPLFQNAREWTFPEESLIKSLLLVLTLPGMQVGAFPRINQTANSPQVDFLQFFPLETGPLPANPTAWKYYDTAIDPDFFIFLPDDLGKLSQLRGHFTFNAGLEYEKGE